MFTVVSEAGWPHAAVHPGGKHHQQSLCALGPGRGDGLHSPGPVYWPVWGKSSQQTCPLQNPQEIRPLPF